MADERPLRRVYRPLGARVVSAVSAGVLVGLGAFLWLMLPGHVRAQFDWFQRGTLIAFFVLVLVVLYGIFRTRADATDRGLSVTNGYRRYRFAWPQIVSITMTRHRPWAMVDLTDGSTRAMMALQASDGPRAVRAAREIAELISTRTKTERDD